MPLRISRSSRATSRRIWWPPKSLPRWPRHWKMLVMTHETKTVRVELGDRAYDILIGSGLIARAGREIAARLKGKRMAVITDEHVASYLPALTASLDAEGISVYPLTLPAGEKTKSFEPLMQT